VKNIVAEAAPDLTREFTYSIDLRSPIDDSRTRWQIVRAFPELVWREGDENPGKSLFRGKSQEEPPAVEISFFCKETVSPFQLTVRLRNAGLIRAEELKNRFIHAIPGMCLKEDRDAFLSLDDCDSVPWVNTPADRPCLAIYQHGVEILISRRLLETMAERANEIKSMPRNQLSEEQDREELRGGRAKLILAAARPIGTDGNCQLPMELLPGQGRYLLAHLLEHGLAEVVHFNRHGMALLAKRIDVDHFGVSAGPTAGFGGVRFHIGLGKEILTVGTWVS
jgi:hypothetical protein